MEVIKTKRLMGYDVTLIRFEDPKGYEVQISKDPYNEITDTDGVYTTLKAGLEVWRAVIKEIKDGVYDKIIKLSLSGVEVQSLMSLVVENRDSAKLQRSSGLSYLDSINLKNKLYGALN